jgi:hypothetical protein
MALFQRVCELDLEGIVAKEKFGPYVTEREQSTWFKILSREYSQTAGLHTNMTFLIECCRHAGVFFQTVTESVLLKTSLLSQKNKNALEHLSSKIRARSELCAWTSSEQASMGRIKMRLRDALSELVPERPKPVPQTTEEPCMASSIRFHCSSGKRDLRV